MEHMDKKDNSDSKERTFTGTLGGSGTMENTGAAGGGGGCEKERDAERIWRELSMESRQEEPRLMKSAHIKTIMIQ